MHWLLVPLLLVASLRAQQPKQPNILFCIADDWGYPHASAYGDAVVQTPAFDRVAQEGVLFAHCYVTSPSCTPSRNSVLTGQYHWRLGPGANLWSSLDQTIPVFPLLLEANGYQAGYWRKSWGPGNLKAGGYRDTHPAGKHCPQGFAHFLQHRERDAKARPKPFCFWLGAFDPHRPYQPQSGKAAGIDVDAVQVPGCWPKVPEIQSDIADYYAEVQSFDRDVGEALRLLEACGELEHTIVVVTGDHGMPFPRGKSNCYELGVRVPLALRWGERIPNGQRVAAMVSLVDLAPTFLRAANVAVPDAMNGHSLWPLLKQHDRVADSLPLPSNEPTRPDHVIFGKERHTVCRPDQGGYPSRGMRTARWAYIRNFEPDRWPVGDPPWFSDTDPARSLGAGTTKGYLLSHQDDAAVRPFFDLCFAKRPAEELYDMQADPEQLHNLASQPEYAKLLQALWQQLKDDLLATKDPRVVGDGEQFDRYPYYGGGASPPATAKPKKN